MASDEVTSAVERLAVYIANLFFLTSDTSAPILKDKDLTEEVAGQLSLVISLFHNYLHILKNL